MPQWAGSCWYYLRYLDPTNENELVDPAVERYWMGDGDTAASTSTSAAPSTRCCTCSTRASGTRCCSTSATCRRPSRSTACSTRADHRRRVHRRARRRTSRPPRSRSATASVLPRRRRRSLRHDGKMGKSLKNAVAPDDIYRDYGADTLRLYEMFMGPLDASRPWNTADIVGVHRFLQRFWRNVVDEDTGELRVVDRPRPTTRPAGCCTARSTRSPPTWDARVQHRDRPAVRAQQPAHAGGRRAGERAARGRRRRWC